jgi:hypothetical protein
MGERRQRNSEVGTIVRHVSPRLQPGTATIRMETIWMYIWTGWRVSIQKECDDSEKLSMPSARLELQMAGNADGPLNSLKVRRAQPVVATDAGAAGAHLGGPNAQKSIALTSAPSYRRHGFA